MRPKKAIIVMLILTPFLIIANTVLQAAGNGTIEGVVTDKAGKPIIGASVQVVGTNRGAVTDFDGRYIIKRMEPGVYSIRITHLEYETIQIDSIVVKEDTSTELTSNLEFKTTDIDNVIKVEGKQDQLKVYETANQAAITHEEIETAPVTTVDDLVAQAAGVVTNSQGEAFIRGGRVQPSIGIPSPVNDFESRKKSKDAKRSVPEIRYDYDGQAHDCNEYDYNEYGYDDDYYWFPDGQYDAMFFKDYGTNPFINAFRDNLSTFAIDVDDASYVMTRSYLERGSLPPEEAVRVEEFVNHFDYNYDAPYNAAFQINVEGGPAVFGPNQSKLLKIGIKGKEIANHKRQPANLVFVIDVSGSMAREDRLELVKKSLRMLIKELKSDDQVGIVIYGSRGEVLLEPTSIKHREYILNTIGKLQPGGSTNAEEGILLGYKMANKYFERNCINRVILCSDGVANVGRTGPDQILREIERYTDKGITLSTVGFGMGNYNDILMEKLSNKGNGSYSYVDDIKEAHRVFVENLTGMLQVIARDVKIQVEFNPEVVKSYRLLGYENRDVADNKFRDDTEDGGEIGSGHAVTALYEIVLNHKSAKGNIAMVNVRYKDPKATYVSEEPATEISYNIPARVFSGSFNECTTDFRLATAAAEFSEILRGSYWAKGSSLRRVYEIVRDVENETDSPQAQEFLDLIRLADRFEDQLAER
ncbi:MAG: von Willebrand factor type A domain-containing protein [bacterium]